VRPSDLRDAAAPQFNAYHVPVQQPVANPKLDLASNPLAKTYRTVLRNQVAKGTNYAGHYRVAVWGCGSSCAMFAVVDLSSGKVILAPAIESVSGVRFNADGFLTEAGTEYWGFRYREDSTLLVIVGTLNEDESRQGAFYFRLNGDGLELVHETIVKKNCE
jgi:hypothetical protein